MPTTCETVTIVVKELDESFLIPAYTRSTKDMTEQLAALTSSYLRQSLADRQPVSLGDFALFTIARAAQDPLEV